MKTKMNRFALAALLMLTLGSFGSNDALAGCEYCPNGNLSCRTCARSPEEANFFNEVDGCTTCNGEPCSSNQIQSLADAHCRQHGFTTATVESFHPIPPAGKPFSFCVDSHGNAGRASRIGVAMLFSCSN